METQYKRYPGRVKIGEVISGEYVDWFIDDDDALAGYKAIMTEQGYTVKAITITDGRVLVEINN
jgi:hypothetical protein